MIIKYLDELSRRSYTLIHVFDDFENAKKITKEINTFFLDKDKKISFDDLGLVHVFSLGSPQRTKTMVSCKRI